MSASYPNSVKSFASRQAAQTIGSAHVNDLQDEVAAIETGLLTGTAPLNSSNSTVASLNVVGELTVGTMPPSVRVTNSTATTLSDGVAVSIGWNTQKWISTSSMHSTSVNPTRLIPPSSGLYLFSAGLQFAANSSFTGIRSASVLIDGSSEVIRQSIPGSTLNPTVLNLSGVYRFASTTQYAELQVFENGAATLVVGINGDFSPWFSMTKLR